MRTHTKINKAGGKKMLINKKELQIVAEFRKNAKPLSIFTKNYLINIALT